MVVDDVNGAGRVIQRRGHGKPSSSLLHDFHMAVVYMTCATLIGVHSCQIGVADNGHVEPVFVRIEHKRAAENIVPAAGSIGEGADNKCRWRSLWATRRIISVARRAVKD